MSDTGGGIANLKPLAQAKEQRAWYFYDWANSAFSTTIAGVLFAPYLIAIAKEAAVDDRMLQRSGGDGLPPLRDHLIRQHDDRQ